MKEIMVLETNFSNSQIGKMKNAGIVNDYGFDGGWLFYKVKDKDLTKAKSILGKAVKEIKSIPV
jgi:hypothetical protein